MVLVREPGGRLTGETVEGWTEMMFPFSVLPLHGRKIWDSGVLGFVSDSVSNLLGDLGLRFLI